MVSGAPGTGFAGAGSPSTCAGAPPRFSRMVVRLSTCSWSLLIRVSNASLNFSGVSVAMRFRAAYFSKVMAASFL